MEDVFREFCDASKKGSTTATDKTVKKICTDCKIYSKKLDANAVDIALRKFLGNRSKEMNYESFMAFVDGELASEYAKSRGIGQSEAAKELRQKISQGAPKGHGTTGVSGDAATARLTDVKGYTGSHAQRFDAETGKGKGLEGREDRTENTGYVGAYKGKGTYDAKH
ncbi:p25-alpha [Opisthorchis viverrini]|uniref:p25-alpha n=2 Tax=Opisthorchis viverrini TaxID=6198 RepID=A0A1S8WXG8_OPIVI